ncbi:uncharacterized protein LOC111034860 [Myzus persicae]|uniref:uncharacterized protein LOC111034860 n=1 Tax=Myzus persicae TaxID=13164 RepID=UPI000B936972|nr:uncharacterized protein LOC111034860 [Myzus persicae]
MNSNEMRQKFYKALSDLLKNKREDNKSFLNKEEYMLRLQEVKLAKEKIGKKSAKDYRYIRIGRSPYEAMFGCPVRLGVASVGFPLNETTNLNQEEDIEEIDIIGDDAVRDIRKCKNCSVPHSCRLDVPSDSKSCDLPL